VRESDLRVLFKRQAASELPPAPVSIPDARRIGRARLLRRRAARVASPVLAAAAVAAVVVLAVSLATGPRQAAPSPVSRSAPETFNPLVPYAAVTWYPYRPSLLGGADIHTALLLRASASSPAQSTEVALYASGWCTLQSATLSCGTTAAGTRVEITVTGRAPDVQGKAAYWARYAAGNWAVFRPGAGAPRMLAFQYAPGGWAVVESTGTPADVVRIAASLRYGQTSPLRLPFRLTGLPAAWSDVLLAQYTKPGPGAQAPTADLLLLGSPATRLGSTPHNTLSVETSTRTALAPVCKAGPVHIQGQPSPASSPGQVQTVPCPSQRMINGYRVFLNTPPVKGKQTLFAPDAGGLYLNVQTNSPAAPLSTSSLVAGHLRLLGPDPANWTTAPVSP
jgi:hypothetical protein